jgi:hypothetical protein
LSRKIVPGGTIDKKNLFGVGKGQNCQAGCLQVAVSGLLSRAASGREPSNSSSASSVQEGSTSLCQIEALLNERGITTSRGVQWSAVQVKTVLEAL